MSETRARTKATMVTTHRARQARITPTRRDRLETAKDVAPASADDFPIVALGASAGGLEAVSKLLDALPADSGTAFILIQHLDPTHESMMVKLLSGHTAMKVQQAADLMPPQRDHVYVIPPRSYLSISEGTLHLSTPR